MGNTQPTPENVWRSPDFESQPERTGGTTFLLLSDTHNRHDQIPAEKLPADPDIVLIHAGDLSMHGMEEEISAFNRWLGTLPYRRKLLVPGNHDRFLDPRFHELWREGGTLSGANRRGRVDGEKLDGVAPSEESAAECERLRGLLSNAELLINREIDVDGLRVYGTPAQPKRERAHCGFEVHDEQRLAAVYAEIPDGIDLLITHGPPLNFGDLSAIKTHGGSVLLQQAVLERVKPKFHVFGHVHTDCGVFHHDNTTFINGAICSAIYQPTHDPFMFFISHTKSID